ncbi:MAG: dTDP-4-dehydrorhamnose 3,5-epimerase [Desulfovibrio sp.]|nr:dTDP-4-dehydrorhamnose 3,5-epimerase [Desulfovibrio sp.]
MEFKALDPNGPVLLIPRIFGDERGFFMETFRQNEFEEHCGKHEFVQDNHSKSGGNVLRGLHYQLKNPQGKLVRVISGKVFDAVVDLRRSSPNFGKSYGVILDAEARHSLWVPPGFAHGFLVLEDNTEFVYKCTAYYDPTDEHCLLWNDPELGINWPLTGAEPVLSAKDRKGLPLRNAAKYV